MDATGSLINQTPTRRGGGLGSNTRHDGSDIDFTCESYTPPQNHCFPVKPLHFISSASVLQLLRPSACFPPHFK
ncbi:unnamed protein product [Pleuronectes platessa]|uniref:Uncharacterized protein n=1 Tax=Pleuronectes platessa TaxID=8262 RepID=A0A9N7UI59_PLEPL|nr:unnamed protein product [Pleuronectes platessa]